MTYRISWYRAAVKGTPEIGPVLEFRTVDGCNKQQADEYAKKLAEEYDWRFLRSDKIR